MPQDIPAPYAEIYALVPEWTRLLKELKTQISDDYRASDDPDDTTPGMCVTIGFTPSRPETAEQSAKDCSWHYQTGDNSFTGGAYGHRHWGVISLYRRSHSARTAEDLAEQIAESVAQSVP